MNAWSEALAALQGTGSTVRRTVWAGAGAIALVVVVALADLADGVDPGEVLRWGIALAGTAGLALHTVGEALYRIGRARAVDPGVAPLDRFRPGVLRRTYRVLPMLSLLAASLLAFACGAMIVVGTTHVRFWLAAAIFGAYAHRAGGTLLASARELYGEAVSHREAAARARSEAIEARLLTLQARMNPHFLFNALNTVAALVRTDPQAAERTVESLSALLRRTLRRSDRVLSTVADEVSYLQAYLAIEAERFGDRLDVQWAVEPEALACSIPPMTLQPLVENALEHGLGARLEGGAIRISAELRDGELIATVSDDGRGMGVGAGERTGMGNLRERLETLYRGEARLDLESSPEGTTVRIHVPISVDPDAPAGPGDASPGDLPCAS